VEPLVEVLRRHVMAGGKLHADDTPVRCWRQEMERQKPGGCGPMCAMTVRGDAHQRRCGSPTRRIARASIRERTSALHGTLQRMVTRDSMRCTKQGAFRKRPAGALRRKFYDLHVAHKSLVAAEAMERIAALYAIEKEIRGTRRISGARSATHERDRYWTR